MARMMRYGITLDVDEKGAIRDLRQVGDAFDGVGKSADATTTALGSVKGALGAIGFGYALKQAGDLGLQILQIGGQFEILDKQLESTEGSVKGAAQAFEYISQLEQKAPFTIQQITDSYIQFKNFGLDPVSGSMEAIIDVVSRLGGGEERLQGITIALGQAWTKQKLQGEEALQLMERGVPVWDLLSEKLGKTTAELQDMSSKGKLGRDAIQLLIDAAGEWASGAAAKQMQTLPGQWSSLMSQIQMGANDLATGGAMDAAKNAIAMLREEIVRLREDGTLDEWGQAFGNVLQDAANAIPPVVEGLATIAKLYADTKQFAGLGAMTTVWGQVATEIEGVNAPLQKLANVQVKAVVQAFQRLKVEALQVRRNMQGIRIEVIPLNEAFKSNDQLMLTAEQQAKLLKDALDQLAGSVGGGGGAGGGGVSGLSDAIETMNDLWHDSAAAVSEARDRHEEASGAMAQASVDMFMRISDAIGPVQEDLQAFLDTLQDPAGYTPPPPSFAHWEQEFNRLSAYATQTLSRGIIEGITGGFDKDILEGLVDSFAGMLKQGLGNALNDLITGQGSFGDWRRNLQAQAEQNPALFGLGGASMAYQGYQQGGAQGALTGAMGGAMAGMAIGGPPGAIVGAIVGGLAALFGGGEETPETRWAVGPGGSTVDTRGHQGYTDEMQATWEASMNAIRNTIAAQWSQMLQMFGDPALWEQVLADPSLSSGGRWMQGGAAEIARWIADIALPEAFEAAYAGAISSGLSNLGISDATIQQLWQQVGQLPGEQQMQALQTYIQAVVDLTQLTGDMDWNAILDRVGQDSTQAFVSWAGDVGTQVDNLLAAMGHTDDMAEAARLAQQVYDLSLATTNQVEEMMRGLYQMAVSVNQTIDSAIRDLQYGDLDTEGQRAFLDEQYAYWQEALQGSTSMEGLQSAWSNLQWVMSQYQQWASSGGVLDPYGFSSTGASNADFLAQLWESLRGAFEQGQGNVEDILGGVIETAAGQVQEAFDMLAGFGTAIGEILPPIGGLRDDLGDLRGGFTRTGDALDTFAGKLLAAADAVDQGLTVNVVNTFNMQDSWLAASLEQMMRSVATEVVTEREVAKSRSGGMH